ncbi:MAG: non-ribosomal peptide synthase, partial [bacterium]|nr:non-ribosomal peptide synthase [bacterium]
YIKWLEKQHKNEGLRYWKNYLQGCREQTGIPGGKANKWTKETRDEYKPEEYNLEIDEETMSGLNDIAGKRLVTVNIVFQTLWGILLQKYNDCNDVVFGAVTANRPPEIEGIEEMIGLFINTIPVRVTNLPGESFPQLLNRVRKRAVSSRPYEYLPLAEIQAKSALKINLIDHIMIFENYLLYEEVKKAGMEQDLPFTLEDVKAREQTHYNFNIVIVPGKPFLVKFTYNANVY